MRALVVVVAALAGCQSYAHRSMHNAPPVVDLDTPPHREVGDPKAFEQGSDPGTSTLAVFVMPNIVFGSGRLDVGQAATETGVAFRFERLTDKGGALLRPKTFALTVGVGLAQFYDTRPTQFGATFAELNYRFLAAVYPIDVGMGVAIYPGSSLPATMEDYGASIGGQLSVRLPATLIRARYMTDTGFEIMGGIEIPIPFWFQRSR